MEPQKGPRCGRQPVCVGRALPAEGNRWRAAHPTWVGFRFHVGLRSRESMVPNECRLFEGNSLPAISRVGDHQERGSSVHHRGQGTLKRFGVERREAFIENDQLGTLEQGPGKVDPALLAVT